MKISNFWQKPWANPFGKNIYISKFPFLDKNHGLTRLERINFLTSYKCTFFSSNMVCLLLSTSFNTTLFQHLKSSKRNNIKLFNFWQKPWAISPLENFDFFIINKSTFLSSRMAIFHQIEYFLSFPKREIFQNVKFSTKTIG